MSQRREARTRRGRHDRSTAPRRPSQRGAVLVELALVTPVLVLLLFAIIDFGFVFSDWLAVRQGGSDALRQALVSTKPTAPGGGTWSCATGGFNGTAPGAGSDAMNMVCFAKARVGLDPASTRVKIFFGSAFAAGKPAKVCVQYKASSRTGFFAPLLNSKVVSTQVESLIEQDNAAMTAVEEKPITGGPGWPASCNTL